MVILNFALILILGFLVWRRGRDRRVEGVKTARWLRIGGLIALAVPAAIFLLFGVGEMAGGDLSGAMHLVELAVTVLVGALAWMRPLEGGAVLAAAGGLFGVTLLTQASGAESAVISPAILILALPQIVAGVLFFLTGLLGQRAAGNA
jgi:hypothetical protein